jgi:hypothetical protein
MISIKTHYLNFRLEVLQSNIRFLKVIINFSNARKFGGTKGNLTCTSLLVVCEKKSQRNTKAGLPTPVCLDLFGDEVSITITLLERRDHDSAIMKQEFWFWL